MARKQVIVASLVALMTLVGATAASGHVQNATVDSKGQLLLDGAAATVSGTIRCTTGEQGSVFVILSQTKGQKSVIGSGSDSDIFCTGSSQGWSVTVTALDEGTFKSGPAAARVDACSNDMIDFTHSDCTTLNVTVHLQR
jgi:hypothetical protein